ncbi:MAG: DMT family transporter [Eggerthellales bacterium]|nr:DMT family transporter [Eggerthellales bacterium]
MKYRLLIVAATIIWGSSFVVVKDAVTYVDPTWIIAIRFSASALILAAIYFNRKSLFFKKEYVSIGLLFGLALFAGYYYQTVGIQYTTPGKNAFFSGTYCIMVPFLAWFFTRKKANRFNITAAVLAVIGIGLVSMGSESGLNKGDFMTLLCAFFFAIHICLVAKFSEGRDIYVLTMWQFAGVGICSFVTALVTGAPLSQLTQLDLGQWGVMAYLTVLCTTVALLFQNVALAKIPPSSGSLLLSLESPFGVMFSVMYGAEVLTFKIILGFCVIFVAVLVSEWLPDYLAKRPLPE